MTSLSLSNSIGTATTNNVFKYSLYTKSQLVFTLSQKGLPYSVVWIIQGKVPAHTDAKILTNF